MNIVREMRVNASNKSVLEVWSSVKQKLPLLLAFMIIVGMGTYFIASLLPPKYASEAIIIINQKDGEKSLINKSLEPHIKALTSNRFITRLIQKLDIKTHPEYADLQASAPKNTQEALVERLASRISGRVLTPSKVSIRVYSSDPELAAKTVNIVANEYISLLGQGGKYVDASSIPWLRNKITAERSKLAQSENEIQRLRESLGEPQAGLNVLLKEKQRHARSAKKSLAFYTDNLNVLQLMQDFQLSGYKAKLFSRGTLPSVPVWPRKGPIALFMMSLAGVLLIGSIFVKKKLMKEFEEAGLSEKHYIDEDVPIEVNHEFIKHKKVSLETPEVARRGIYPWLPEEKFDEVIQHLLESRTASETYRILVSGEDTGIFSAQEAIQIGRSFSDKGISTLLVDCGDRLNGVSQSLNLNGQVGFRELVHNPKLLKDIVHSDKESSLQVISCGHSSILRLDGRSKVNIIKIFNAWSAVYKVVIVCCSNETASDIYDILDGSFEAGVFVQRETHRNRNTVSKEFANRMDEFDIIYYRQPISDNEYGGVRSPSIASVS